MSSAPNTPESSITARRMSESSTRSRLASKFSLRPASCTGWNVTPRTHRHSSACLHDRADFAVVDAALHGDHQRGRDAVPFEIFQRLAAHPPQVRAAQVHQRVALERIELQIDFEPALALGQLRDEIRLLRDAQAVGIDHHVADRAAARLVEDREELRMQGRLAAGNLHQVGLALARDQRVEHARHRRDRQVFRLLRRGLRKAHRTGEIAVLVDLDQRQARMLFVIRAQPAIVRAAELGAVLEGKRLVARLDVVLAHAPVGGIARQQRGLHAVLAAALLVPDLVADDLDLRRHQRETGFAQRLGLAPEDVGPRSTQRRVHADCLVALAPSRSSRSRTRTRRRRGHETA